MCSPTRTSPKTGGHKLLPTPVKEYALSQNLPVYQPEKMRDGHGPGHRAGAGAGTVVVAAYGRILPVDILETPKYGSINVHASILPKYRGAAPINWAILNDEPETGVSIMYMAQALDAGDVLRVARPPIGPEEDLPSLWNRLRSWVPGALRNHSYPGGRVPPSARPRTRPR